MRIVRMGLSGLRKAEFYIFNKLAVKKRLMLFFSILIVIPLISTSMISYARFSSYVENITLQHKFEMTRNALEEIISNKFRDEKLSDQILMSQSFQNALTFQEDPDDPFQTVLLIRKMNSSLASMEDTINVNRIIVIGDGGKVFYSNSQMNPVKDLEDFKDSILYKKLTENTQRNLWVPLNKNIFAFDVINKNKPFLYLIRKIDFQTEAKERVKGISIIQLKQERFCDILSRTSNENGEYSVLADSNGVTLCNTQNSDLIGTIVDRGIFANVKQGEGSFISDIDHHKYLLQYTKDTAWSIIQFIPYENIFAKSKEIRYLTMLVMFVFLLLALLLSIVFAKHMTDPVVRMTKAMGKFGEGNLDIRIDKKREDEFGRLYESFNRMAEEIKELLQKNEENNKQRRKLELNILEYQINPHFLYNTLESIHWSAQKSGNSEIGKVVDSLTKFFRISLSKGKEFIRISEEIDHVTSYLNICKFRYADCFSFAFNMEENIMRHRTVKLILQPVVENSIKHGVNKNDNKGLIRINGKIENEAIILEIIDNGRGMEEYKLKAIQYLLKEGVGQEDYMDGIGLINVSQRIKLYFGDSYGIDIESMPGKGTAVKIKIPIIS